MLQWISRGGKDSQSPGTPSTNGKANAQLDWLSGSSDRYYGLENFGNTCYCNSVLQSLYFSIPFRSCLLAYNYPLSAAVLAASSANIPLPPLTDTQPIPLATVSSSTSLPFASQLSQLAQEKSQETLLSTLQDLFRSIQTAKKQIGPALKPTAFVTRLKKENELFQGTTQQDAQEFLNYLLNAVGEILVRHQVEFGEKLKLLLGTEGAGGGSGSGKAGDTTVENEDEQKKPYVPATWMHELFEGHLTNETKCLTCETTTNRDEAFLDLSVDVTQHTSLSTCLRNFSTSETLCAKDKFYCDNCKSLQEAEKRMKIKRLPNILAVHLKRFKYHAELGRFIKLNYRVVFPLELKLFNTSDDAEDPDRLYHLSSIIIHLGIGPHQGHYITIAKSGDHWILFDDENVDRIDESELSRFFGDVNQPGTGYIFMYERVGFDVSQLLERMDPFKGSNGSSSGTSSGGGGLAPNVETKHPGAFTLSPASIGVKGLGEEPIALNLGASTISTSATATTNANVNVSPPTPIVGTSISGFGGFSAKFKRPSFHNTHPSHIASVAGTVSEYESTASESHSRASGEYIAPSETNEGGNGGTGTNISSWWKRKP
ncbi:UNVERIFIED_CONTAM: Ubiquitin carboxyl-terminal hydrolase 12 [Siphonaria sp. JEL0065]|nr:Ubiquitin carboxyl-terminal hydrolase 12 [Siphonaria sp. JEL0065]